MFVTKNYYFFIALFLIEIIFVATAWSKIELSKL
jgi:hypothetical protein|tara:strand:- start:181 stop:282 length:102 start_codon:yes stop_codon:yes gene_type:complete